MSMVTVVIPVYNREKYLSTAIESVLNQTYKDWKLIIMDDGSTDDSNKIAAKYLYDSRIQFVRSNENVGIGKTMNAALSMIDTPYFVTLDSDDWFDCSAIELLLQKIENSPESTSVVYSNTVIWADVENEKKMVGVHEVNPVADKYEFIMSDSMVWPRFYRTKAVRDVGGFETDDPMEGRYMYDWYILLKLIDRGRFDCVQAPLYNQLRHDSNISRKENWPHYAKVCKYVYTKILKQWGDDFKPVFALTPDGGFYLKELVPKRKASHPDS